MKKTIWKRILCAVLVMLTACVLCTGAFAAKYTCIKSGCTREAAKGSAYKPTKSNSSVFGSGSRPSSSSSSTKHKYTPASRTVAREKRIRTLPTAGYIALPNLPPRAALLTAPNLRTAVLTQTVKNPTRRMIPMTMATMPSTMMTTTMRIATTATRTTQQTSMTLWTSWIGNTTVYANDRRFPMKAFITITGLKFHFGSKPFEVGQKVKLVKEPDNEYDSEAIKAELPGFGCAG